jgi:hypothetical protein
MVPPPSPGRASTGKGRRGRSRGWSAGQEARRRRLGREQGRGRRQLPRACLGGAHCGRRQWQARRRYPVSSASLPALPLAQLDEDVATLRLVIDGGLSPSTSTGSNSSAPPAATRARAGRGARTCFRESAFTPASSPPPCWPPPAFLQASSSSWSPPPNPHPPVATLPLGRRSRLQGAASQPPRGSLRSSQRNLGGTVGSTMAVRRDERWLASFLRHTYVP